jgi:hypothetical protein
MLPPDDPHENTTDGLLRPGGASRGDGALRDMVLAQTLGVMRRRRRWKRVGVATGLLICYLAGMATPLSWIGAHSGGRQPHESLATEGEESPAEPRTDKPVQLADSSDWAVQLQRPHDFAFRPAPGTEQLARARKPSKYEIVRRDGDRMLRQPGNLALAVRRYHVALDLASAEERAIAPGEDSWLLMALKNERMKENAHDRTQRN